MRICYSNTARSERRLYDRFCSMQVMHRGCHCLRSTESAEPTKSLKSHESPKIPSSRSFSLHYPPKETEHLSRLAVSGILQHLTRHQLHPLPYGDRYRAHISGPPLNEILSIAGFLSRFPLKGGAHAAGMVEMEDDGSGSDHG